MKKLLIFRKRLMGIFLMMVVYSFFTASTPNDCIYITKNKMDASILRNAVASEILMPIEYTHIEPTSPTQIKHNGHIYPNLEKRYIGLGYSKEHPYIRQVINDFLPTVEKYCNLYNIPPSVIMGLFINEFVIPNERRLTVLAAKYHNYGSLKEKEDDYISNEFKKLLDNCIAGIVKYKDDDTKVDKTGKIVIVPSSFYSFKNKDAGIHACIAFIADRVKSKHPNYVGKFDNLSKNDIYKWAYGLYDAGYAKKDVDVTLDMKIIRIIRTYKLADI